MDEAARSRGSLTSEGQRKFTRISPSAAGMYKFFTQASTEWRPFFASRISASSWTLLCGVTAFADAISHGFGLNLRTASVRDVA